MAFLMNEQTENIGARRLHTILEKLLEDISFNIPDVVSLCTIETWVIAGSESSHPAMTEASGTRSKRSL